MNMQDNTTFSSLASLSMDLKRAALGFHRGSYKMARRFEEEALKREAELHGLKDDPYISQLLEKTQMVLDLPDGDDRKAEDLLMCSTLIQNYCLRKFR